MVRFCDEEGLRQGGKLRRVEHHRGGPGGCFGAASLEMFSACEHASNWAGVPYMIENPVGKFSDHMGKPNHTFQPWEYGENYTKLTCLWTGNGFVMPPKTVLKKPDNVQQLIWRMPPSKERQDLRSITPIKFAEAVFGSNRMAA